MKTTKTDKPGNLDNMVDELSVQPTIADIKKDGPVSTSLPVNMAPKPEIPPMPKNYRLEKNLYEPYYAYQQKDTPQNRATMLKRLQPIINTAVYSYADGKSPAVMAQAKLQTLKALKSYDPARGPLKSHILSSLRRLRRTSGKAYHGISLPEKLVMDRSLLQQVEDDLQSELGRAPSDGEIADKSGLSLKRIAAIRAAGGETSSNSFTSPEGDPYTPASKIPGQEQHREELALKMLYYDLDKIDQAVLDYTYGWNKKPVLSNAQVAKKLNITPAAVSQRRAKIQKQLFDSGLHDLL